MAGAYGRGVVFGRDETFADSPFVSLCQAINFSLPRRYSLASCGSNRQVPRRRLAAARRPAFSKRPSIVSPSLAILLTATPGTNTVLELQPKRDDS